METRVIKIEYRDGSTFKVFCANRSQVKRTVNAIKRNADKIKTHQIILNALHTAADFEKIAQTK